MALQHKRFPPGRGNLLIPTSTRAATLAGIAMYSPSTRRGFLVQRAAWYSVGLFGSKGLPGNSNAAPPLAPEVWDELHAALLAEAGPYDDWAAHRPPDPHREGLGILLLQEGRPVAFVKVRRERNCEKLRREFEALGLVREANPHSFGFTEPLFEGTVAGRLYAGFAPLPAFIGRRLHRRSTASWPISPKRCPRSLDRTMPAPTGLQCMEISHHGIFGSSADISTSWIGRPPDGVLLVQTR